MSTEFGAWGNRTEEGDLARPDTRFAIGSCSKAFFASAMGILIDDFANGRNVTPLPHGVSEITFDTKIQALFPGDTVWKLEDEWATQKASLRDILSHLTGITRNDFSYNREDTPLGLGKRFRYLRPGYELREQWTYTNLMYLFGSHIISTYSGKTLQEFVKERIFDPLNMTATSYTLQEANTTGLMSQSWTFTGRRIPLIHEDSSIANLIAGAGGIISNAVDMSKWLATILNRGVDPTTNKTIIPRFVYDTTTSAQAIEVGDTPDPSMSIIGYGMGWDRKSFFGHDLITHDGGLPGFVSTAMVLPNDNLAIISLLNTDAPIPEIVPLAIVHDLLEPNKPFDPLALLPTLGAPPSGDPSAGSANCANVTIPLESFAGTYVNPGYGNLTFCAPSQIKASNYCMNALSDLASISPNSTVEPHTLVAVSPRIVTHVSMQRTCASTSEGVETFSLTFQSIYPNGYGRDTSPFSEPAASLSQEAIVECELNKSGRVEGCAWLNFEPGNKRQGSLQEKADVWWEKI